MKIRSLFSVANCLALGGLFISSQVLAAAQSSEDAQMKKILLEEQKLEHEVNYLNNEVTQLKREKRHTVVVREVVESGDIVHANANKTPHTGTSVTSAPVPQYVSSTVWSDTPPPALTSTKRTGRYPSQLPPTPISKLQSERITNGLTVTTSPYVGLRSAFDASDLVVYISTMNEDLRLLQQRQKLQSEILADGEIPAYFDRPMVVLSGAIEAQASNTNPYQGSASSNVDLTRAEFNILGYISSWATGLISMGYDNGPLPNVTIDGLTTSANAQVVGAGQKVANSRFYLKRGFLTIGDLSKTPFYFTAGQMYVPFGAYTSQILDSTLPQSLGQLNERAALLGFYEKGVYLEGYLYNGETGSSNSTNSRTNRGGANIGYKYSGADDIGFNVGAGIIGNLADSLDMQLTNAPVGFQGFGFSTLTEQIQHTVPATDVHGELDIKKLSLIGEFLGANRAFDPLDLSFNGSGAKPSAMHLEADYTFNLVNWPSVFTLAYGHSWESLALNLPQNSYIVQLTTSIWKDTIEAIEFRHDSNYPSSDFANGNNTAFIENGIPLPFDVRSVGGTQNTVTAQIGVYF